MAETIQGDEKGLQNVEEGLQNQVRQFVWLLGILDVYGVQCT